MCKETLILESLFNKVASLKTYKETQVWVFFCEFLPIFGKVLLTEHFHMTAHVDSFVPNKVLCIDQTLFFFSYFFFPFNIDNYNYRSLLRKCIKMNKKIQLGKPALNNFKAYKWQK